MSRSANRSGFTFIEMAIAMALMSLVLAGAWRLINSYNMQSRSNNQAYKISMLANAIKSNAKVILDAAGTVCTNITSSTSNDVWGWRNASCVNTSPFPVYNISTNVLTYNMDTANFANAVNTVINTVGQYCSYTGQTATTVTFNCSALLVTGLQYKTSVYPVVNTYTTTPGIVSSLNGANVTFIPPHNSNSSADFLNFLDFPSAVYIQYNQYLSNTGSTVNHNDMLNGPNPLNYAYQLDLTDLYLDRVKKTRDSLIALDAALRGYGISKMTSEFENVPPGGLSSKEVFFIPWIWQVLASTQADTLTLCNNSTTCSSIVSGSQWATSAQVATYADAWVLITTNLMTSNLAYTADAFGNPLRIVPLSNGCTGDVSACLANNNGQPPLPEQNYLSTMVSSGYAPRPPYTSLMVSPLCTSNAAYPDFCRWTVVYPN